MSHLFEPAPYPVLAIKDRAQSFPVRRIYCVGRNYAAHAAEMGHDASKEEPFFFQKNPDSVTDLAELAFPRATADLHPEVELVVALSGGGTDLSAQAARDAIYGYAVGLDLTRRDLQQAAKASGRPWEVGKSFEQSAPMSALLPAEVIGHPRDGAIWLSVNGVVRQNSVLSLMLWSPEEIIVRLSQLFTLAPGDLIMTGTPEGVGKVVAGDRLQAGIAGVATHEIVLV